MSERGGGVGDGGKGEDGEHYKDREGEGQRRPMGAEGAAAWSRGLAKVAEPGDGVGDLAGAPSQQRARIPTGAHGDGKRDAEGDAKRVDTA